MTMRELDSNRPFTVYAPIQNCSFGIDLAKGCPISEGMELICNLNWKNQFLQNNASTYLLSPAEINSIDCSSDYALRFEQLPTDSIKHPQAKINIFLLALWLAQPSTAVVNFYFCSQTNPEAYEPVRLIERQKNTEHDLKRVVTQQDLEKASALYAKLKVRLERHGRLENALHMTFSAFLPSSPVVAIICFSSAAEVLLVHGKDHWGVTKRLATAYACLTKKDPVQRQKAYCKFLSLYRSRGDIVHGRMQSLVKNDENESNLYRWSQAIRNLWLSILEGTDIVERLEEDDHHRNKFFRSIQSGFLGSVCPK